MGNNRSINNKNNLNGYKFCPFNGVPTILKYLLPQSISRYIYIVHIGIVGTRFTQSPQYKSATPMRYSELALKLSIIIDSHEARLTTRVRIRYSNIQQNEIPIRTS